MIRRLGGRGVGRHEGVPPVITRRRGEGGADWNFRAASTANAKVAVAGNLYHTNEATVRICATWIKNEMQSSICSARFQRQPLFENNRSNGGKARLSRRHWRHGCEGSDFIKNTRNRCIDFSPTVASSSHWYVGPTERLTCPVYPSIPRRRRGRETSQQPPGLIAVVHRVGTSITWRQVPPEGQSTTLSSSPEATPTDTRPICQWQVCPGKVPRAKPTTRPWNMLRRVLAPAWNNLDSMYD